ncbi:hypothetical protein AN958_03201 [Leucoagaricus sp. SymC.cos]|nr:hypothetical protein AN958_03201 [Leucoagaricus sp. SymC.cos]
MSSSPTEVSGGGVFQDVHIFSQNVNCNYAHVDYVLENLKDSVDVLFFQEPPWRTIRQTVSIALVESDIVMGAPRYPDWLYMVRPPTDECNPCVIAYVHRCLAHLCPSMQWDIIDHWDIFVLSLFTPKGAVNFLNIYSDNAHTAINLLSQEVNMLPAFIYMGGDFNCHSKVWDPAHTLYPLVAQHLLEFASDVRLEWAHSSNPGLTHTLHNPDLASSVIDLVFMGPLSMLSDLPRLDLNCCGPLDHVPISTLVPISEFEIRISRMVILRKSPEESGFLIDITTGLWALNVEDLFSPDTIEVATSAVAEVFSLAWNAHAKEVVITACSKS